VAIRGRNPGKTEGTIVLWLSGSNLDVEDLIKASHGLRSHSGNGLREVCTPGIKASQVGLLLLLQNFPSLPVKATSQGLARKKKKKRRKKDIEKSP